MVDAEMQAKGVSADTFEPKYPPIPTAIEFGMLTPWPIFDLHGHWVPRVMTIEPLEPMIRPDGTWGLDLSSLQRWLEEHWACDVVIKGISLPAHPMYKRSMDMSQGDWAQLPGNLNVLGLEVALCGLTKAVYNEQRATICQLFNPRTQRFVVSLNANPEQRLALKAHNVRIGEGSVDFRDCLVVFGQAERGPNTCTFPYKRFHDHRKFYMHSHVRIAVSRTVFRYRDHVDGRLVRPDEEDEAVVDHHFSSGPGQTYDECARAETKRRFDEEAESMYAADDPALQRMRDAAAATTLAAIKLWFAQNLGVLPVHVRQMVGSDMKLRCHLADAAYMKHHLNVPDQLADAWWGDGLFAGAAQTFIDSLRLRVEDRYVAMGGGYTSAGGVRGGLTGTYAEQALGEAGAAVSYLHRYIRSAQEKSVFPPWWIPAQTELLVSIAVDPNSPNFVGRSIEQGDIQFSLRMILRALANRIEGPVDFGAPALPASLFKEEEGLTAAETAKAKACYYPDDAGGAACIGVEEEVRLHLPLAKATAARLRREQQAEQATAAAAKGKAATEQAAAESKARSAAEQAAAAVKSRDWAQEAGGWSQQQQAQLEAAVAGTSPKGLPAKALWGSIASRVDGKDMKQCNARVRSHPKLVKAALKAGREGITLPEARAILRAKTHGGGGGGGCGDAFGEGGRRRGL
jgi:hypothetical protein